MPDDAIAIVTDEDRSDAKLIWDNAGQYSHPEDMFVILASRLASTERELFIRRAQLSSALELLREYEDECPNCDTGYRCSLCRKLDESGLLKETR